MRKRKKAELTGLLDMLEQANNKIKILLEHGKGTILLELLEICQDTAINIGTYIEEEEGPTVEAIDYLKRYCEELYVLYTTDKKDISDLQEFLQQTKKWLYDLPNVYKMVFLPYKASMWDCMESVWQAAEQRSDCQCYVVPIPYYDKDKKGNLTTLHYEGKKMPGNVPIENWEEFSLEQVKPDFVFIHNPYDDTNYVTSVEPRYYSDSLKKLTDCLVLLPYAVSSKDVVAEEFATTPGILYADKVFVQSNTIREGHIKWFHKFEERYRCQGVFGNAEEKFQVTGSPKFDKAYNVRRENYVYPTEWQEKVVDKSGHRKKVILFNSSINQLLHWDMIYIEKLKRILDIFEANQDILLLWRPHPLMEQTISSMRSELLEKYKEIVRTYKEADWGIYDESSDMYPAIAFSDVYYGDWSSVATVYQCAGKPVIQANYNEYKKGWLQHKEPLAAQQFDVISFCVYNKNVYLYDAIANVIYHIDMKTKKAEIEVMLPHETRKVAGYSHIEYIEGYLVLAPKNQGDIVVYSLKAKEIIQIENPNKQLCRFCMRYRQSVIFSPVYGNKLIIVDATEKSSKKYVDIGSSLDDDKIRDVKQFRSSGLPFMQEHKLFMPFRTIGVLEYDCLKEKTMHHELADCATMTYDGRFYWWCDNSGKLYRWDYDRNESILIRNFREGMRSDQDNVQVYFLAYAKEWLFLLPHQYFPNMENKVFRINVNTCEVQEISQLNVMSEGRIEQTKGLRCYCGVRVDEDNKIWTYCNARNTIVCIDAVTCEIEEEAVHINTGSTYNNELNYIQESKMLLMEYFFEYWNGNVKDEEQIKVASLLETRAWKQMELRRAEFGIQDLGVEYLDGQCGARIIHSLVNELEEK